MAAILKRGPAEVQGWIEDLRNRLQDPVVLHVLPPLVGLPIDRPGADFVALLDGGLPPRDDADLLALFAIARAGIRLSHLVVSPWYFAFTRDIDRRARWAAHLQASRRPIATADQQCARADFAVLAGTVFDAAEGFSVHDIVETHAIVEGLQATMARPSAVASKRTGVSVMSTSNPSSTPGCSWRFDSRLKTERHRRQRVNGGSVN
jgi:hypothetical protein